MKIEVRRIDDRDKGTWERGTTDYEFKFYSLDKFNYPDYEFTIKFSEIKQLIKDNDEIFMN